MSNFKHGHWWPRFKGPVNKELNGMSITSKLMVSYNRKLNLLKSFYFLPIQARLYFYFKVILPSITYGILIWGSVGKTVFDRLEKIHIRAAGIIHGYAWDTPALDVQRSANWRSLKLFYDLKLLSLVFNSYHNLSAPLPLQNLYEKGRKFTISEKQIFYDLLNSRRII